MIEKKQLYFRHWPSQQNSKAVVLFIHGLNEYCERYRAFASYLNQHHYSMAAVDLPGHGYSQGSKGHIDDFDDYKQAALLLYEDIQQQYPGQAVFLLGHSMGGLIATKLSIDHASLFSGLLLSAPAIQSPQEPAIWEQKLIGLLARLAPKLKFLSLGVETLNSDPQAALDYQNDHLIYKGKLSVKLLYEILENMHYCQTLAPTIKLPINILHGIKDTMTAPEGSQLLIDLVASEDKSLTLYENCQHELFREKNANEIYAQIVDWLEQRV